MATVITTKPKVEPPRPPADLSLLTEDDRKALREQARKAVLEEMAQHARDAYYESALKEARNRHIPAEVMTSVTIDLAEFAPCIKLDGREYFNGVTYQVPMKVAAVLHDQMYRSHVHQDEIDGRRSNFYRRSRHTAISPMHAGVSAKSILGMAE